jgi:hypothetical protein
MNGMPGNSTCVPSDREMVRPFPGELKYFSAARNCSLANWETIARIGKAAFSAKYCTGGLGG